jgi:UDP-N-acetylmuramate--alanine ligase
MVLEKAKKVFFVGIGGIGISAIARMFLLEGREVFGIDISNSIVTDELTKHGAKISIVSPGKQSEFNIPNDIDLVVYTIAIEKADPEFFQKMKELNKPMKSYPEMLELISRDKFTIAISGTHGKTTTTAMIAKIMIDAGLDPTVIVGSLLKDSKSNFIAGKSKFFVVEACEYRRSFLNIHPTIAVVINIDEDHLDYYSGIDDIKNAFRDFIKRIPSSGYVVTDTTLPHISDVVVGAGVKVASPSEESDSFKLKIPGKHNRTNALLALAVSNILGINKKEAVKSLENFQGTWRRFEHKGVTKNGALVIDDYGHHPVEIKATIIGAREAYPGKKIKVIFQPHLYSRTKAHLETFAESLALADSIHVADIYPAREPFDKTISSKDIVDLLQKINTNSFYEPDFDKIADKVGRLTGPGDLIITMGAGETDKIAEALILN